MLRTAKFWKQYLEYIDVLKLFIMAEWIVDCCNVAEFHIDDIEDGDHPLNDDAKFDQNILDLFD